MDVRTLFISDLHLGTRHANTEELLAFLGRVRDESPPEKLFIVGDFIDGWSLQRNWHWDDRSTAVVRKILSFVRRDTEIYWVAGNHDDFLRAFVDDFNLLDFGRIHLGDEFVHETATGRRLLVVHGDYFDLVTRYAKWLCWLGDVGYELLLRFNRHWNRWRRKFGLSHWSLSKAVKANVKRAVNYVSDFETCLTAYARERGCDGVVCGHIHSAELVERDGFLYANSGDWVESCTAVYEDHAGVLHLYEHHPAA